MLENPAPAAPDSAPPINVANSMANPGDDDIELQPHESTILQHLSQHSVVSPPISWVTYFPSSPLYLPFLRSYIRNLRFSSPSTSKPLFIVAAAHVSHIQASVVSCKTLGIEMRIRSGGHDYDGLSYVSTSPFMLLDMCNLKSITVNVDDETAWVESGALLSELFYKIAEKSKVHGFPAGICPTVGIGGHFSGGGYGNLVRKYGLSSDHIVDAKLIDADGKVMDRESMGEDVFWAIRGGGGANFGVILSWKIKLVPVPEIVSCFKIGKTIEQGAIDLVHKWQYIASTIDENLFIKVVFVAHSRSVEVEFYSLFLGNAEQLVTLMNEKFPELGLSEDKCIEMSWIESVLFWAEYPRGIPLEILRERHPLPEECFKKKSDYVQEPISKENLEGIWKKIMELSRPSSHLILTLNPYGGKMSEISESETPFPHRAGNLYMIHYKVAWREDSVEASDRNLDQIGRLYDYMTPYVSKSPRCSFPNCRDVDIGMNRNGNAKGSHSEAMIWGRRYFKGNFDRLVRVKRMVDPGNFFRHEQSIPLSLVEVNKRKRKYCETKEKKSVHTLLHWNAE